MEDLRQPTNPRPPILMALSGETVPGTSTSLPLHSRKLTWKPKRVPIRTTVALEEGYLGFHVSLGECNL